MMENTLTCTYTCINVHVHMHEDIVSQSLQYQNTCTQREREKERVHTFIFNILDYKSICSCFKTTSPTLSNNTKPLFIRLSHIIKNKKCNFYCNLL